MPQIGDIKKAKELGYKGYNNVIWFACSVCGKERWVRIRAHHSFAKQCWGCAVRTHKGEKSANWKGGRIRETGGYVSIWVSPNDFFHSMADNQSYIREHRLVIAKHLGRCLQRWEVVHHKNGIKDDNRLGNLELTGSNAEHSKDHSKGYRDGYLKGLYDGHEQRIKQLEARVTLLEAENVVLKMDKFIEVG